LVSDQKQYGKILHHHQVNALRLSDAIEDAKLTGVRPKTRPSLCSRKKVDAQGLYEKRVVDLHNQLVTQHECDLTKDPSATAFVTFRHMVPALTSVQGNVSEHPLHYFTDEAPVPKEIHWDNLAMRQAERTARGWIHLAIIVAMVMFWTIPIAFVGSLISLENLQNIFPFLEDILENSSFLTGLLQGFLPTVALKVFMAILPFILKKLAEYQGWWSESLQEMQVLSDFFLFQAFNVFLGITIGGAVIKTIDTIANDPSAVVDILAASLPAQSTFFINYILLNTFVAFGSELLSVGPLIGSRLKLKFLARVDQSKVNAWSVKDHEFSENVPEFLLVVLIGMSYSCLAPITSVFVVLFFGVGYIVWIHQCMYTKITYWSTGGRMYSLIYDRVMFSLIVFQLLMIGVMGTKKTPVPAGLLVPVVIVTGYYWMKSRSTLLWNSKYAALHRAGERDRENEELGGVEVDEYMYRRFGPVPDTFETATPDFENPYAYVARDEDIEDVNLFLERKAKIIYGTKGDGDSGNTNDAYVIRSENSEDMSLNDIDEGIKESKKEDQTSLLDDRSRDSDGPQSVYVKFDEDPVV